MIELKNVSKVYKGNKVAIHDVNLTFDTGDFICFIGTSGSGKTTTMRMINRMNEPTTGEILIDGKNIQDENPVELRRSIGYVIQSIGLLPHMTIEDNITLVPQLLKWSKEKRHEIAKKMIRLVELPEEMLHRYPQELSGGQQQRIGVVRALAADQKIILMDEPFGALDPITRDNLQDLIKDLQERLGKTIIFVTHDMDEALRLATKIVIMDKGEVVQFDTPENILKHPANDFVEQLLGEERLLEARPNITTVKDIMNPHVISINVGKNLYDAIELMRQKRVDSLPVIDDRRKLVGMIDINSVRLGYTRQKSLSEVMFKPHYLIHEDDLLSDIVRRFLKRDLKNVFIVNHQDQLTGILTRATLVDIVYDAIWGDEETEQVAALIQDESQGDTE